MTTIQAEKLFDLSTFPLINLFENQNQVWEVLGAPLKEFCQRLQGRVIEGKICPGAFIEGEGIYIGPGAVVEPGAFIKGPCWIGPGTEVRHGAYLRGNVIAGRNCVIGHTTEVKNSIFLNDAKAGHFAYVGDSILGNHVNLGAGTKLANLKIIPGNVILNIKGQKIDSGLRKFGAILGDRTELGCNSVTSPGTILAPGSLVFPAIGIKGVFLEKTILRESNMNAPRR